MRPPRSRPGWPATRRSVTPPPNPYSVTSAREDLEPGGTRWWEAEWDERRPAPRRALGRAEELEPPPPLAASARRRPGNLPPGRPAVRDRGRPEGPRRSAGAGGRRRPPAGDTGVDQPPGAHPDRPRAGPGSDRLRLHPPGHRRGTPVPVLDD